MKRYWPIITLILSGVFLCFQNYTPGTILSGWDTLHPEFNFGLAIKRELFGVFRTYQGLGAVAAHSDMADLPRIILLYLLSPFIPMSFLRYSYIFTTLIIGPIGMYYFLRYVFVIPNLFRNPIGISRLRQLTDPRDDSNIPAFLGALFYLLNLGTMQQFIVPFEMFVTQYASLPWLFLFATTYIYNKTHQKRTLLLFALATLFSAPMAYAATLWYVYFIAFIVYLAFLSLSSMFRHAGPLRQSLSEASLSSISNRGWRFWMRFAYQNDGASKQNLFKKAFTLILLTLLINSFWILPNIYFVFTHGSEVPKANINKLFSEQAFLYNKEFGNIADILMLKTFLFDWNIYSGNNHFTQLLHQWITHLKQPFVQASGFLFAGIAFSGIVFGILKKNKILIALLPLLFLCLFFLLNDNSPTSSLYSFLQAKVPFLKEAYRFPQNKVLGIFTFLFAIYFAAGQLLIARFIKSSLNAKINRHSGESRFNRDDSRISNHDERFWTSQNDGKWVTLKYVQTFIFALLLLYFMLPAFKGNFISSYMRIKIPSYYFEMFSWFNKEKEDGRIANLPINSFWGWEYHDWSGLSPDHRDEGARLLDRRGLGLSPSFQGAGFIWFGIRQPVLARDFDRWSPYNEQYYREISYAIYSQNPEALKLVLEKYNIKYILIDKTIIAPDSNSKVLLHQETQTLLKKQDYIEKVKEFDNTIFVYKVKSDTPNDARVIQNPAFIHEELQATSNVAEASYEDLAYKDYGNYITKKGNVYYPLNNLIDNQSKVLPKILKITQEGVVIKLPKENQKLTLPLFLNAQDSIASDLLVEKHDNKLTVTFYPRFPTFDIKNHPIPIIVNANLPPQDIILSINKKDNFILNTSISDTPLSLDMIGLNTKKDNTIAFYPSTKNEEIAVDLSTIKYYAEPCEDTDAQKIFGIEKVQSNSFYIFGKNTHLCMTIPLSEVILKDLKTSEALLNVAFNYKSNLPLKFCIAKLINAACQNYSDNRLNQYFGIQKEDIQKLGLQFQLDTTNSNSIGKALINNLTVSLTYPFSLATLPNDALKNSIPSINGSLSNQSKLSFPYSGNDQLSANITKLPTTNGQCPNTILSNPPLIKKQILENNKDNYIRYLSTNGLSCDHFSYKNLSQNEAYLIAITSRNVKGLPLTLCMTNIASKHCDIYTNLSSYKDFNTDIFLLPPQIRDENGFDVNIRNLGIKKTPAINDLKSIEIIPFPYKWLTQIKSLNEKPKQTSGSVLVLQQSFEKGWKAYQVQSSKLKVKSWANTVFPFVFGKELKDHVLVNGWANGWESNDPKTIQQFNNLNNETIVILFLPQYLEYLGFILLLGTFALLIFAHRPTPKKI